jgi:putative isomerase
MLHWKVLQHGEWGLRFWVNLCLTGTEEFNFVYDRQTGQISGTGTDRSFSLTSEKKPLLVTQHPDLEGLTKEYQDHGYFYLASRAETGDFLALRFNLEEAPTMSIRGSLENVPMKLVPQEFPKPATGPREQAWEAVHDVIAWNHVWDAINQRPYTALSRFWNKKKFGGFGVWLNDILYNAWMWGFFDVERSLENLDAVFAHQTQAGNFPCLVTGNDAWLDRTQPPIAAFVVWSVYEKTGRKDILERYAAGLLRNLDWWWSKRQLGDTGLLCFGTSLDAGDGLYKGTKLAAKDESTMDNSPLHDPVPFDEVSGLLLAADVGVNSMAALDGELLERIFNALGELDEAQQLRERTITHKQRITEWLWDESRGIFANRMMNGEFVSTLAPTSFFPMAVGIGSMDHAQRMIYGYLNNPSKFGGEFGLPSVTRDDPAYSDNVYWRGRIWAPLNFWVWQGLRRQGFAKEAEQLAEQSWRLFEKNWKQQLCGENFNAETGEVLDQPDTDGFYSWGALLAAMKALEN